MNHEKIQIALSNLQQYIEAENYLGYDPYDGLKSPVFKLPFLKSNKFIRFGTQQLVKRFPLNLRILLGIKKGYNPVTLGLGIQAYANLIKIFPDKKKKYNEKINFLIDELEKMIPENFHGACWGYDFDWEARYSKIPAYQPTIVATGFITNALFKAYTVTGNKKALEFCTSATQFILNDINKTFDKDGDFCFSYSPFDKLVVFNASMKGARALSQIYSVTKDENLKIEAKKAVAFILKHQRSDGAWIYSTDSTGAWVDNYHTGYILDCLDEYIKNTGDSSFDSQLQKGFQFYRDNFFTQEFAPKFYDNNLYPVDSTSGAQSILTLIRFGDYSTAMNVASWMIKNMQSNKGYFYFRMFKKYTIKTSFMRWSNAWMFAALAECVANTKGSTQLENE